MNSNNNKSKVLKRLQLSTIKYLIQLHIRQNNFCICFTREHSNYSLPENNTAGSKLVMILRVSSATVWSQKWNSKFSRQNILKKFSRYNMHYISDTGLYKKNWDISMYMLPVITNIGPRMLLKHMQCQHLPITARITE